MRDKKGNSKEITVDKIIAGMQCVIDNKDVPADELKAKLRDIGVKWSLNAAVHYNNVMSAPGMGDIYAGLDSGKVGSAAVFLSSIVDIPGYYNHIKPWFEEKNIGPKWMKALSYCEDSARRMDAYSSSEKIDEKDVYISRDEYEHMHKVINENTYSFFV